MRREILEETPVEEFGKAALCALFRLLRRAAEQVSRLPAPFAAEYGGDRDLLLSWGEDPAGRILRVYVQAQPDGTYAGSVVRYQPGVTHGEAFSQVPLRLAEHWHWVLFGEAP